MLVSKIRTGTRQKKTITTNSRPSGDFSPFPPFSSKSPLSKFHPIWIASCLAIFAIIAIACISGRKWDGWGNPPVHIISHFNLITFTRYVEWAAIHVTSPIWGPPPHPPCQDRRISSREKSGSIIFFWLCLAPWLALLFSSVPLEFGALKRWDNLKGRKPEVDKGFTVK